VVEPDAPANTKTRWLWLAWVVPSSMPVSMLAGHRLGVFETARAHLPNGLILAAITLAPLGWFALTLAASLWIARDISRENSPGRKDGCGTLAVAFGIFCFQAVFAWGITLVAMSTLGE